MAYSIPVKFFNSFWMKKVVPKAAGDVLPATSPATTNISWPNTDGGDHLPLPMWPGLPWNPTDYPIFPWNNAGINANPNELIGEQRQWYVEEACIRGGFNNTRVSLGVRAYLVEDEEAMQQHRANSLIYSGVYNSRTGINDTNVFSIAEDITKSLNPAHGSIQKLFAENTNLNIFQENKVSHALIDKDAVYTAEGSPMQTTSNVVIGQTIPYLGEYGISKNPESFATYGFQKYFVDANRGIVGRLSRDGITEISSNGMRDWFRDNLSEINSEQSQITLPYNILFPGLLPQVTNYFQLEPTECGCDNIMPGMTLVINGINTSGEPSWLNDMDSYIVDVYNGGTYCTIILSNFLNWDDFGITAWPNDLQLKYYVSDKVVGGWDIHNKSYTVSLQPRFPGNGCFENVSYHTLNFDESINGWVSFYDFNPTIMCSLKNSFLSSNGYQLWKHHDEFGGNNRGFFYDQPHAPASISFIFNPSVSIVKSFQTLNYEGSNGWEATRYDGDPTEFNQSPAPIYPVTDPLTYTALWQAYNDTTQTVASYEEGKYVDPDDGITYHAGFVRKENKYVSELKSQSKVQAEEVIYWDGVVDATGKPTSATPISGLKGFFVTVDLQTDLSTDIGGLKELFAVSSNYVVSST